MDADGTGTVGTSEVVAGARVWLQLSPSSLPAEGATSETEEEEERQEEWGEEGEAGGGSKKEGAGGGGCPGVNPQPMGVGQPALKLQLPQLLLERFLIILPE